MEALVGNSEAEILWRQCLTMDHESDDPELVAQLYKKTHQALVREIQSSGSRSRRQVLDKHLKILHEWAKDANTVLS